MRTHEVFHERGCTLIGTSGEFSFDRAGALTCCGRAVDGQTTRQDWRLDGSLIEAPITSARVPDVYMHVEHPEFAQREAQEQRHRLDGWVAGAMRQIDAGYPDAGASILESVMNHMTRYGTVP